MRKSVTIFRAATAATLLTGVTLFGSQARRPCPWQGLLASSRLFTNKTPSERWVMCADEGRMAVDATMFQVRTGLFVTNGPMIPGIRPSTL